MVDVHVFEAGDGIPAALAHVVHRDRAHGDLVTRVARRGRQARERILEVLDEPPVAPGSVFVGPGLLVAEDAADELHVLHLAAVETRPDLPVRRRQAVLPDAGRLDHVVVDRDDLGDLRHDRRLHPTDRRTYGPRIACCRRTDSTWGAS